MVSEELYRTVRQEKLQNAKDRFINASKAWILSSSSSPPSPPSSPGISEMPLKVPHHLKHNDHIECNKAATDNNRSSKSNKVDDSNDSISIEEYVSELIGKVCDKAVDVAEGEVTFRDNMLTSREKWKQRTNRMTRVVEDDGDNGRIIATINENNNIYECRNNFVNKSNLNRRCASMYIVKEHSVVGLDENDNNYNSKYLSPIPIATSTSNKEVKKKKKLSFNSIFSSHHKKDKKSKHANEEHSETYDTFDFQSTPNFREESPTTITKSRKSASALELNRNNSFSSLNLQRTPSLIKKIVNFGEDSASFLRRSISFRDSSRKKRKEIIEREKEIETRNQLWRQSLQSLVETDTSVSYNDLSFVNYDALNRISYHEDDKILYGSTSSYIGRTQSWSEKRSPEFRRPAYQRVSSALDNISISSSTCLPDQSAGALSLPSLHRLNGDNEDLPHSTHKYRRRPQSISSEDGSSSLRIRPGGDNESFRSARSGCAKLKRHNATRQKIRDPNRVIECRHNNSNSIYNGGGGNSNTGEKTVRSRSLNHLDTLEMRQGVVATTDAALKDSRSEPDCTKPVLAAPTVNQEPPSPCTEAPPTPVRKHMLSRSQKSSSECFSVYFEVGDESTWENELFFPAQRGITLHDSLAKMCEMRNIDLSMCDARLQDKETNTECLILFTQDTAHLVGRQIRITAKDSSNKKLSGSFYGNHSRKQSGSYRPRTSSFFNSSTEETPTVVSSTLSLHEADQSKKQIKQRLTAFFGNSKDTKYEALIEQLDRYSRQGIPNNFNFRQGQCESIDALYNLEEDWREIIDCSELTEKQQQQQTALWELIKTEVAYIKTLKVVTDLFLSCLKDLQSRNLLKEIDTEKLFSNITEILDANVVFWRNTLFPMVRYMRKHKRPSCIEIMLEGFSAKSFHEIFQPYYKYCAEQSRCQHYCRENLDSEVFAAYLTWCESQKDCNRLRLMDILVQPMQRLTKYGLLLKAILKNTDENVERDNLIAMIRSVDEFVNCVNSSLKLRQDNERLKGIIARIESYDIVESKDDDLERILKKDRTLTQLDLTRPMLNCPPERKRHLLLEGDLKLKDSGTSKMEVHCFLLTDMLLICKPSTKKGGATMRVIRQPYLVDRLVVSELHRETPSLAVIYKNEFDMAVAAFILQNNDAKKIKGWKEGIAKAQTLYAQVRQMSYMADESLDTDYSLEYNLESDYHSLQLAPRSPLASSSRASRVSSLAHSHSGSVEMNDQSSIGSQKDQSRGISMENDNRTGSISSDEGVQPLPSDKSPVSQKNSFKNRLFNKTPNTLSVQPYGSLGQSLPNLTLGSPNVGSMSLSLNQNTLSVPGKNGSSHLLSPTHRGISYPPPSPTRGNLRRSLAISQSKNPPLVKTRQVNSTSSVSQQVPNSFDFDVPVIAGVSNSEEPCESFSRGHHRQAMKRSYRYHTAGIVDDIKKNDNRDASIHKRLSWNCTSQEQRPPNEDQT